MTSAQLALVSHPLCPFVQRAAIVLLEKNVPFERIDIDLAAKPDWFLMLSPLGKVPLLRIKQPNLPDAVLFESTAICEYLNETQDGVSLYAADPLARAQQRAWAEFGLASFADAWQFLNARDPATATDRKAVFRHKLQQLEDRLTHVPYFSGPTFGMVDVTFAPLFRYFDLLHPDIPRPIFDGLPRVSAWRAALAERPSVISAVRTDYAEQFQLHLVKQQALLAGAIR
ncbi:glutathione S-transferase [Thalassospira xiamenensis]|uniref:glutathione S-transferase family protein n=1 Tax=Thalassospira xiamenensis TaxID=220697 RepID=UPI000DED935F|nr:glutathione S-transferase family protein [Thalassospira xiamenensis]RCK31448.1 glutathione S-transferase [Thalassospira xiamenensis]